uniref:non-specific serine/threonine protein kinase n=1 Tax=Oryza meridionalis TaxID=40149 RepID=A0A0E0E3P9_9ORYZ
MVGILAAKPPTQSRARARRRRRLPRVGFVAARRMGGEGGMAAGRKKRVGRYEVGRTIGQGTFAKVLDKDTILNHRMLHQIKREISIMKIVRHPNIVRLNEVLAGKTKIYIILELITGGELFDKIARQGKLRENEARKYFQQLIDAIDYCHSKGVYHRDLKPENLLLDSHGNLKVSDFGLSTLAQKGVGLLHTTCGTPNYVAPEVLSNNGYDGSAADVWSCGVILYVLMAGYLPFEEDNLPTLYDKRITIEQIREDTWFKKTYVAIKRGEDENVDLDDVQAVFDNIEDKYVSEQVTHNDGGPLVMNAFEMITLSQGLDLSALFDRQQEFVKRQTRFVSRKPAKTIVATIEVVAETMGLMVHSQNYKLRLEGVSSNRMSPFAVVLQVFEVAPSLFMVDVRKVAGDTLEYHRFYKNLCNKMESIIWRPIEVSAKSALLRTATC